MHSSELIIRPFEKGDLSQVACLIALAFSDKWGHLSGVSNVRLPELLVSCGIVSTMPHEGYIVAQANNSIVGVIELRSPGRYYPQPLTDFALAIKDFGCVCAGKMLLGGILLSTHILPFECYIEHVAVGVHARGRGVGSKLIKAGLRFAASIHECSVCKLCVAAHNAKAIKLYKNLAFSFDHEESSVLSKIIFGVKDWQNMIIRV